MPSYFYVALCAPLAYVTTRNPNFQQLAKDKELNPNQWEVQLVEFNFCEDTRPDPQLQKAKA